MGDALKLLKHQLEQSAEKPSPDEANALNASGHNRKLPWWSCNARRAQEVFVIALDEEDNPAGEPGTPFSRERHLNRPERQSIVEPAHILARPKPAAKCMVTKAMKNPKKRKRFKGSVSIASLGRADLPKRQSKQGPKGKASMKLAIELAKANNFAAAAIQNIEKDYYANSSRSAKEAKRKAVKDLLAAAHMAPYPLDPKKIKLIAGVLREGGYKSADTYLVEAKTAHIELFMMREIELAALTTKDVKLDHSSRLVTVTWRESKMDQEGSSISRTLQCICMAQCGIDCH